MDIRTLYMKHFTKNSVLSHIQGCKLKEIVYTILKLHTMLSRALGSVDKLPDFIKGHSRRYLNGSMLSMLHGIKSYRGMMNPVGNDIYKVEVFSFAHLLIGLC